MSVRDCLQDGRELSQQNLESIMWITSINELSTNIHVLPGMIPTLDFVGGFLMLASPNQLDFFLDKSGICLRSNVSEMFYCHGGSLTHLLVPDFQL